MKNLFIIDGAAGTGKSDLMEYLIKEKNGEIGIVITKTNRDKRKEEVVNKLILDLEFVSQEKFDELKVCKERFYFYGFRENQYGFFKYELEEQLRHHDNVVVIIRNDDLPQTLKKDFSDVRVILVYIYTDEVQIEKRLKTLDYTDEMIAYRIENNQLAYENYLTNPHNYDRIIINNSDKRFYKILIDRLIAIYNQSNINEIEISNRDKFPLIRPLWGHKEEIMKMLDKYPYEKNVFLMMRYRPYNNHLFEHIKSIINDNGFNCVRADIGDWDITHDVYNPIAVLYACKYGIALFDEPKDKKDTKNQYNPNVTYELGMMHLQGKECLILKHNALENLPFDIIKDLYRPYTYQDDITSHVKNWIKTKLKK